MGREGGAGVIARLKLNPNFNVNVIFRLNLNLKLNLTTTHGRAEGDFLRLTHRTDDLYDL